MITKNKQTFAKNEIIYAQGQGSAFLYIIESGNVGIVFEKGHQLHLVNTLGPKNFIGEVEFFCNERRLTSAVALSDVTLYCLKKADIIGVVQKCPEWVGNIVSMIGERNYESMKVLIEHNIYDENIDDYIDNKSKQLLLEKIQEKKNSV